MYAHVVIIHAAAMGTAFLLFAARELLFISARRGQIGAAKLALTANRIAGLLTGIGIAGGIGLIVLGGWPLSTPWLLMSFTLIAALMIVESRVVRPWEAQVHPALEGTIDKLEVRTLLRNKRALGGRLASISLFALIIALMVVKPDLLGA
ncbi:DUF2269 family protein [Ensifer sp. ENS03]|jgi:hypothetical protein|uniref:DUF2269 family protein n=1 Tax=Ensifer sp. ENS03 TaxID=2769283 RepID=UPI000DDBEB34|nr:DUF2269 family protein [Ensifer sp. ENS03]MBD9560475.1 DUF2269 family protein [Ensifer sp. ENS03]